MPNPRLAARYAKSVLDLSVEKNQLEEVYADMQWLNRVCKSNRDFVNQNTGEPYPAERVPGTELSLCTGTSNDDKRRGIQQLISQLGLPSGSVEIL